MKTGTDGRIKHTEMINAIPFVISRMAQNMPEFNISGTIDECFSMAWTGITKCKKGRKIPDGVIAWNSGYVLIECGVCNPNKWPNHPWIHWGFDGVITVINDTGDPMISTVYHYLQGAFE